MINRRYKQLPRPQTVRGLVSLAMLLLAGSVARADGSSTPYGQGGMAFPAIDNVIGQYNRSGELFRIEGSCRSSCTQLLAIKNVCVDPSATLEFHAHVRSPNQPVDAASNKRMANYYNSKLRNYLLANHFMDTYEFHAISGQEIVRMFGYRPCAR